MRFKKYFFLLCCFASLRTLAQDTLLDVYGKQYIGKEVSHDNHYIYFRTDEKLLAFRPGFVGIIKNAAGDEHFNWTRYRSYTDTHIPVKDFKRNILAINIADFAFTNLTVSYEHVFGNGTVSMRIPVSLGVHGTPDSSAYTGELQQMTFMRNKNYSGGLELNYYPGGQTRHNYYVGLSGMIGSFFYFPQKFDSVTVSYPGGTPYTYVVINPGAKRYGTHYAGMLHIGGNLGIASFLSIGGRVALGFKREETIIQDYTRFNMQVDVTVAYRF